jgi:hypothetical protein
MNTQISGENGGGVQARISGCRSQLPNEVHEVDGSAEAAIPPCYQQPQQMNIDMNAGGSTLIPRRVVAPPQGLLTTIPFYNVIIPMVDNFANPVNTSVSPSVDPNGTDLPVHGKQSLRFFRFLFCSNVELFDAF